MEQYKYMEIIVKQDPFSHEFDSEKLSEIATADNLTQREQDTIDFLNFCSRIFKHSYSEIIAIFKRFESKIQLFDYIYKNLNTHYVTAHKSILSNSLPKDSFALNFERLKFIKFDNPDGVNINATDVMERGGDILNILVGFIEASNHEYLSAGAAETGKDLNDLFPQLWFYANNIYSFSSFYNMVCFREGYVVLENETIYIRSSSASKEIRMAITVSDIRSRNHINEYSTYAGIYRNAFAKSPIITKIISKYRISNGSLDNLRISNNKLGPTDTVDFGKYLKINRYVEELFNTSQFGIRLIGITEIFNAIERFMHLLIRDNMTGQKTDISYKVKKTILIEAISKITSFDIDSIRAILDSITEKSITPYFWRKPLYEYNDEFYLSFSLLYAANYDLLIGSVIESLGIDFKLQIALFKKQVTDELEDVTDKYTFVKTELGEKYENTIVYELQEMYLFIEVAVLEKFPIESIEIHTVLGQLAQAEMEINEKISEFSNTVDGKKTIIPVLITNYTILSGIILNNVPILDLTLIKNYLVTGNFRRSQVFLNKASKKPTVYNQFDYYGNEYEFNNRLVNFLFNPLPVLEIKNKLFWKESAALPVGTTPQLYIEACDYVDESTNIENKIQLLNQTLNHQYYNTINDAENKIYDISIQFQLTDIFYLLAFGNYDHSFYRFQISEIFQKLNTTGFSHLVFYFRNAINRMNHIKPKQDKSFNTIEYDTEYVNELVSAIIKENPTIRLVEFNPGIGLTKVQEKKLISFSLDYLSTLTMKKYTDQEFEFYVLFLAIIKSFTKKYDLQGEFYSTCANVISALNFNNNYQTARNLSEEILYISIMEKNIYRGWEILFVCLEQQKNIFDATIYGCLYISSLSAETHLPYSQVINIFFTILKFSRNIYSLDLLDSVFEYLKKYKLKEYDDQKIHLSYYQSILLNSYLEIRMQKIHESMEYLIEKQAQIVRYEEKGIVPWLNYLYNIKRLQEEGHLEEVPVDDLIVSLEAGTSEEYYLPLKQKHFSGEELKKDFIDSIKKSLNTNSYSDYIFENQNLDLDASHVIEDGIHQNDFDAILLSGYIENDIRLIYNNTDSQFKSEVPFTPEMPSYDYLENYSKYILGNITLRSNQTILYLFASKGAVYGLVIEHSKNIKIVEFKDWTLKVMQDWLKGTENFYFNDKNYFDVSEQEEAYAKLIEALQFTSLGTELETDEILICTSMELSKFPVNLIVNDKDFLGTKKHVTNILLIEWFLSNHQEVLLSENYTSCCWAPIEDGDGDINYGFDKMKHVLEEYKIPAITQSLPEEINSDVNIFFAHGELNGAGFKAIYKSDKNNSAVISNRRLFGTGKIAILFVCHSGAIDKNIFSNSVISLIHEIIELGYAAVIAPCWSLEVTIPQFWLQYFLEKFKSGAYISEAVHFANNNLAEYKESISNAYYVPEGRLAMHLYGNPNVRISKD